MVNDDAFAEVIVRMHNLCPQSLLVGCVAECKNALITVFIVSGYNFDLPPPALLKFLSSLSSFAPPVSVICQLSLSGTFGYSAGQSQFLPCHGCVVTQSYCARPL